MPQRLHLDFGGERADVERREIRGVDGIDIVGSDPDHASVRSAREAGARSTVDVASMRCSMSQPHRPGGEEQTRSTGELG